MRNCRGLSFHAQIWNAFFGTLKQTLAHHTADVLCLAVNDKEDEIYASGVDNVICQLKHARVDREVVWMSIIPCVDCQGSVKMRWVLAGKERKHTHDVRAMVVLSSGLLVSAGWAS